MTCKFCHYTRKDDDAYISVDFYQCEECESIMCVQCMYTSIRTGRDYCIYCRRNLLYDGRKV
jgi:hypothetical protein